ncbi:hypothetical protein GSI_08703 [Ganoderma sinense ZZ0214-1]|uniref:Uncharacterized protein n=1 Tax=Ganoderma sinense ZZ0214-1 TaxID=1077348 RepID=A0A2G8S4G1_9APHY|nr:hypothetical protein GSI_08703 [Ganoderma sinense ZZ0214-1]
MLTAVCVHLLSIANKPQLGLRAATLAPHLEILALAVGCSMLLSRTALPFILTNLVSALGDPSPPSTVVSLTSTVKAQVAMLTPVNFPPNITLCEPVNFTWTGGTPPYWLYVYGDVSGKLVAQNTTGIPTTWFVWIPDIPAVPGSSLRFQIGDSATHTTVSLSQLVGSESEGSSCLGSSSTAAAATASSTVVVTSPGQSTGPSHSTNDDSDTTPSSSQPTTVSQSAAIPVGTHRGERLSRAAVAGIAAAATFVGIAIVVLAWFATVSARRKRRVRLELEPGQADFDASPYPCTCPITTSTTSGHASGGVPLSQIPPNSTTLDLVNQSPPVPPPATTDSESERGYSVMADVGGPRLGGASPVSRRPSLEMATDPLSSAMGNLGLSQPEVLVNLNRLPHQAQELGRKRGWVPVAPHPRELAELRVECDGVTVLGVSDSEGMRTNRGALEPEHGVRHSLGRAEVNGWEVRSPSDGTALPPYAP